MRSKLTVDLKVNETLTVGTTTIRLERKSGQLARLVVTADRETKITTPNEARMSVFPANLETSTHG